MKKMKGKKKIEVARKVIKKEEEYLNIYKKVTTKNNLCLFVNILVCFFIEIIIIS
jgi:uncharacterized membrane protein